ncbi:MAG: Gfo/Idh/MocA family oxidoreductase [Anaerolineae bacterium]|nr:Gfo/Idh/MocA family oxidoreductase [Anaerolineae bacterium]
MKKIGIGIVGTGFSAELHAQAYADLCGQDVQVVGAVSATPERAQAFARRHGISPTFSDYQQLLETSDVTIVDLCVPTSLHKEFTIRAAQAGKHIICEKPMTGFFGDDSHDDRMVGATPKAQMLAAAVQNTDEMIGAAEKHGVKLMYAENWVYAPAIQKVKRLITASGGTIFELRAEESHHGSHAAYARRWRTSGGGALLRLGSHPLGAILHLKHCEGIWRDGRPITVCSVMAQVANLTEIESFKQEKNHWVVKDWEDVENWATAILTFSDGSKGIVSASDICLGGMKDTLDVFMSNARFHCDLSRSNHLEAYAPSPAVFENEYIAEKLETKAGWSSPNVSEGWALGYQQEIRDFVDVVRYDRTPVSDALLGRQVVRVIYAAYLSAEQGRVVHLKCISPG